MILILIEWTIASFIKPIDWIIIEFFAIVYMFLLNTVTFKLTANVWVIVIEDGLGWIKCILTLEWKGIAIKSCVIAIDELNAYSGLEWVSWITVGGIILTSKGIAISTWVIAIIGLIAYIVVGWTTSIIIAWIANLSKLSAIIAACTMVLRIIGVIA